MLRTCYGVIRRDVLLAFRRRALKTTAVVRIEAHVPAARFDDGFVGPKDDVHANGGRAKIAVAVAQDGVGSRALERFPLLEGEGEGRRSWAPLFFPGDVVSFARDSGGRSMICTIDVEALVAAAFSAS